MQTLLVAVLVTACFAYALWTLAPKALRRGCALALLRLPLPALLQKPLGAAARWQGGCGCDGCDKPPAVGTTAQSKPVVFVRKR